MGLTHDPAKGVPTVLELAEGRWSDLLAAHPEFDPAVALQRQLINTAVEGSRALSAADLPQLTGSPDALAERLVRGIPAFRGLRLVLPGELAVSALRRFCDPLEAGGAGEAAARIRDALDSGRLDATSMLGASLSRDECAFRAGAADLQLSADLLWLVAELAVGPIAHALQDCLTRTDTTVSALAAWDHGYCPACGSWPAFAELVDGSHQLRCSLCAAAWSLKTRRCTYCGEAGDRFKTLAPDGAPPGRRLSTCGTCGGYLKTISPEQPTPFLLIPVEDLASADLDVLASQHGFRRPHLPAIEAVG